MFSTSVLATFAAFSLGTLNTFGLEIPMDAIGRPPEPDYAFNRHSNDLRNGTMRNLCFCSYGPAICDYEDTCIKHEMAACYHAIKEGYNEIERRMETWHYYGCAPLEKGSNASHLTCNAWRVASSEPASIACCYEGGYCNMNITPPVYINVVDDEGDLVESSELFSRIGFLLISILGGALIGAFLALIAWFLVKQLMRKGKMPKVFEKLQQKGPTTAVQNTLLRPIELEKSYEDLEYTWESGSGCSDSGLVTLNQRTIALNLTMLELVARGRYGEVRRALYRGSQVAVKLFYTTEEESWKNERDIYMTQMLNHENVLQFVAADISSTVDALTQMLLITDYHPLGSLYDYLRLSGPLGMKEGLGYAQSIIAGLEHMHSALHGTGSRIKPQIAHRDIKSKNVIVKRPGVCCVADFGLAVRLEDNKILPAKINVQVGTKRYMAPGKIQNKCFIVVLEVLMGTLNLANFDEFKMADIYSFALVLWEICSRIQTSTQVPIPNGHKRMVSFSSSSGIATSSSNRTLNSSGIGHAPRYRLPIDSTNSSEMTNLNSTTTEVRPHSLPYQNWVPPDPSFDEMRQLVCIQRKRPPLDDEWTNGTNEFMGSLTEIMNECWADRPASRHTAYKIKKDLIRLIGNGLQQTEQNPITVLPQSTIVSTPVVDLPNVQIV